MIFCGMLDLCRIIFGIVVDLFRPRAALEAEMLVLRQLKFAFEKETKGAVLYQEVGDDGTPAFAPQVGSLYVRKSAMPGGKIPKVLTVTIKSE
jgi:hypothetical protein